MSDRTPSAAAGPAVQSPARDRKSKGGRSRVRATPKGRRVEPEAREEVRALLGDRPRRRDLLIEYLHLIQDRYHCLADRHLVALADEMRLSMAEVYEVATFYHHFDVVKDGQTPPPAITVRVCDSIACELAGSHELLEKLPDVLGTHVRVLHAPCVGRCETAPVAVVGQNPQMAADRRLRELEDGRELRHRQLVAVEEEEEPGADGIAQGAEAGEDRGRFCHPFIRI